VFVVASTLLQQLRHLEFAYPASTEWKTIKQDSGLEADSRFAAVLVPILDRSEPAILLTKRSPRLAYQPGHISFPGGRRRRNSSWNMVRSLGEGTEKQLLMTLMTLARSGRQSRNAQAALGNARQYLSELVDSLKE
jgi:hypothetical protein